MTDIADKIREACYYIPGKYLQDCSTGMAYAHSQGLIAGRLQALKILEEHHG